MEVSVESKVYTKNISFFIKSVVSWAFFSVLASNFVYGAQLTQSDCNYAIERLKEFNSVANKNPGKRTSFEEKATYSYAEACQSAGMVTIYGFLQEAPEASPEVTKFCQENARSRGESTRCLETGKLDE